VTRKIRCIERFEFVPSEPSRTLEYMAQLAGAKSGWINFLPGIANEEEVPPAPTGLAAFFGMGTPGNLICTWVPSGQDRRGLDPMRLGIMHSRGGRVAADLRSYGVPIPETWGIEQDHPRRGLVLRVPPDDPYALVLDWALRAGAVLCYVHLTGTWQAEVHLAIR
jgi:hypothetical protein